MRSIFSAVAGLCLLTSATAFSVDYDYERAQRAWEDRDRQLDAADAELSRQLNALQPLQQRVNNAQNQVDSYTDTLRRLRDEQRNTEIELNNNRSLLERQRTQRDNHVRLLADAEADLRDAEQRRRNLADDIAQGERDLAQLDRRIRDLENQPSDGPWTCNYVDRGSEEHSGGHPATNDDRATAEDEAEASCLAVHGSCELWQCTQPDSNELTRLRRQRDNLAENLDRKRNNLNSIDREVSDLRSEVQRIRSDIAATDRNISDTETRIRNFETRLSNIRFEISDAELSLGRARDTLADARSARDRQQQIVDQAQVNRDAAFREERSAYAYYQEVLANYNRAYDAAVAAGRSGGISHGDREGLDRGTPVGRTDGDRNGTQNGNNAGLSHSREIATARGYNHGLTNGGTDASLAANYREGLGNGAAAARSKAMAEDYPRAYNNRLNEVFAAAPSSSAEYDITDELPTLPGDVGPLQDPTPKQIGTGRVPSYSQRGEPAVDIPQPGTPGMTIPTVDRRFFAPTCGGEPLPVFNRACLDSYGSNYNGGYDAGYRRHYVAAYQPAFRTSAEAAYTSARQTQHPDLFTTNAQQGARDKGTLDGFANTLPGARVQAEREGIAAVATLRGQGFMPLLRTVSLVQAVDDGNMSPGEAVKVEIVLDNYGFKNAAHEKLQIRLSDVNNARFSVLIRKLPAITADTRVTLTGVLTGAAAEAAGNSLSLKAVLEEVQADGTGTPLDEATFTAGIRMPLELTAVTFGGPLRIGTAAEAVMAFKNNTNSSLEALTMPFSLNGEGLTTTATSVDTPVLSGGETTQIRVPVTPTEFASTSIPVGFVLQAGSIAGSTAVTITKNVGVLVSRTGQLELCVPTCGGAVNLPLHVRAGGTLSLSTQFRFTGTQAGTFEFGKLSQSDNRITSANNSTFRVGPSQWGPGSSPYAATFGYTIPAALRGTTQWVTLYVKAGSTRIQTLRIPFVVD